MISFSVRGLKIPIYLMMADSISSTATITFARLSVHDYNADHFGSVRQKEFTIKIQEKYASYE